jgi:hypothetical protein
MTSTLFRSMITRGPQYPVWRIHRIASRTKGYASRRKRSGRPGKGTPEGKMNRSSTVQSVCPMASKHRATLIIHHVVASGRRARLSQRLTATASSRSDQERAARSQ